MARKKWKIDHDVPIPRIRIRYPWPQMGPGDSVLIPWRDGDDHQKRRALLQTASSQYLRLNRPDLKGVVRIVDGGVRVWFVDRFHVPADNKEGE